jgi:hypothetical protein
LLTLADHAGVRGFEIAYPNQPFDAAHIQPYPYAIRGAGAGVWIADMLIVNAYLGIDLASHPCDGHVVEGVWGTALRNGITVGGGSHGGYLERVAFSYGPWIESWIVRPADRQPGLVNGIVEDWHEHCVQYQFGDCDGEVTWGLVGFDPNTHVRFQAQNGHACTNATFYLSLFDVAHRALIQADAGRNIRFVGLWGTGSGAGKYNWIEVGPNFAGPLDIFARAIQPGFLNHPANLKPGQVRFFDEESLTTGQPATAGASVARHAPALAVDRDPLTYWQAPGGSWLQVDLGRPCQVDRFRIESAGLDVGPGLNALEADLYLSEDGAHFQRAGRLETYGAGWGGRPIEPTMARYVRLVVTRPGQDGVIRIASFDVFGPPA